MVGFHPTHEPPLQEDEMTVDVCAAAVNFRDERAVSLLSEESDDASFYDNENLGGLEDAGVATAFGAGVATVKGLARIRKGEIARLRAGLGIRPAGAGDQSVEYLYNGARTWAGEGGEIRRWPCGIKHRKREGWGARATSSSILARYL